MPRIATYPEITDGPRSPWPGEPSACLTRFIEELPFNPVRMRLFAEGTPPQMAIFESMLGIWGRERGTANPVTTWTWHFQRGEHTGRDIRWVRIDAECSRALLQVLARLLKEFYAQDRRDLSLTVWDAPLPALPTLMPESA